MKKTVSLIVIAAVLAFSLASCSASSTLPANPDTLVTRIENSGYAIEVIDEGNFGDIADMFGLTNDDIAAIIVASPGNTAYENEEMGYFVYCESVIAATKWKSAVDEYMEDDEDFQLFLKNPVVKKSGKVVYFGSANTWNKFA